MLRSIYFITILNSAWSVLCNAQNLCFQCSDPNIEVHYGAFFNNPRILQDDSESTGAELRCDPRISTRIRLCRDPCYTLNVTTQDIRTGRLIPFGVSHGCSTMVLLPNRIHPYGCHNSGILLRTTPAHPLHAQYCFCTGDACNVIRPSNLEIVSTASPKFHMQIEKSVPDDEKLTDIVSASTNCQLPNIWKAILFILIRYCTVSSFL